MDGRNTDAGKSEITREKILAAARKVFSRLPYEVASLRIIAKEGGFDHPLIRYYFPTKADLFSALVERLVEEFYKAHPSWLEGMEILSPVDGFRFLLERLIEYDRKYPHAMRVITQNLPRVNDLDDIPGYRMVPALFDVMRASFMKKVPLSGPREEVDMFFSAFFATIINALGGSTAYSQYLGLADDQYRNWLKNAMAFQFVPWLERLARPRPL